MWQDSPKEDTICLTYIPSRQKYLAPESKLLSTKWIAPIVQHTLVLYPVGYCSQRTRGSEVLIRDSGHSRRRTDRDSRVLFNIKTHNNVNGVNWESISFSFHPIPGRCYRSRTISLIRYSPNHAIMVKISCHHGTHHKITSLYFVNKLAYNNLGIIM